MKSRLLVAAVGVPVILVVILWAPVWVLALFLAVLSGVAAWELMKCVGISDRWRTVAAVFGVGMLLLFYMDTWAPFAALPWQCGEEGAVTVTLAMFACAVLRPGEWKLAHILSMLFSGIVIPYAFAAFLRLDAAGYHRGFLLLPLIFSFASDTGAFFAGRAFGKHKLAPKVSPHKTVEGSIGGLVTNAVAGVIFALVMNTWFDGGVGYLQIALLGLFCSAVAQLGDLSFSLIKREFGIKDYGHIFLEHGGVLDRFDSVLFVAPTLAVLLPLLGL